MFALRNQIDCAIQLEQAKLLDTVSLQCKELPPALLDMGAMYIMATDVTNSVATSNFLARIMPYSGKAPAFARWRADYMQIGVSDRKNLKTIAKLIEHLNAGRPERDFEQQLKSLLGEDFVVEDDEAMHAQNMATPPSRGRAGGAAKSAKTPATDRNAKRCEKERASTPEKKVGCVIFDRFPRLCI